MGEDFIGHHPEVITARICFRARRIGNGQNADWRQGVRGYASWQAPSFVTMSGVVASGGS